MSTIPPLQPGREDRFDVVVVGAGLSGLQAALDLQRAGLRTLVLEARDRVGGKTWTVPVETARGTACVDLGGAWINDSNQRRMWALGRRFGLAYVVQATDGDIVLQDHGHYPMSGVGPDGTTPALPPLATAADCAAFAVLRDRVEAVCQTLDDAEPWRHPDAARLDGLTFDQWAAAEIAATAASATTTDPSPGARAYANLWVRAMLGIDGSETSALYFLHYCRAGGGFKQMRSDAKHGGQHLRSTTGAQPYAEGLAALLAPGSIVLSTPVAGIHHAEMDTTHSCRVATTTGLAVRARKVVVSVPTPLYRTLAIDPPLTGAKHVLAAATRLGYFTKVILVYATPWWADAGLVGLAHAFNTADDEGAAPRPNGTGPVTLVRDTSDPGAGLFALTCFVLATAGREWSRLPPDARRAAVLAQVAHMFTPALAVRGRPPPPDPVRVLEQEWAKEPFSQGCPCPVTPPGVLSTVGHAIRAPVGHLHFVGTETSVEWKGYMEGAISSGERGAAEVVAALEAAPGKARL